MTRTVNFSATMRGNVMVSVAGVGAMITFWHFFILFSFSFGNLMFCVYFFNVFPTYDDKYVFVWHFTLTFFQ